MRSENLISHKFHEVMSKNIFDFRLGISQVSVGNNSTIKLETVEVSVVKGSYKCAQVVRKTQA